MASILWYFPVDFLSEHSDTIKLILYSNSYSFLYKERRLLLDLLDTIDLDLDCESIASLLY